MTDSRALEAELIEEERLSFDDFYRLNADAVGRALALTLGNHGLGIEAADEAFTRAYAKWGEVSGYTNPAGWVYRVGLNWARSWIRRAARATTRRHHKTDEAVDQKVADADLRRALMALSTDHRSVVVLRYYADWSTEQTATALGLATGTVKSRLSRALDQLRVELEPSRPDRSDPDSTHSESEA